MHSVRAAGRVPTVGLTLMIVVLTLSSTTVALLGAPGVATVAPASRIAQLLPTPAEQVLSARSSLQAGLGPANGRPVDCDAAGSSIGCSLARPMASSTNPAGTWTNVTTKVGPGPSGRLAQMAWDGSDGYVLLFGGANPGCGSTCFLADTWTFSDGTWTNITATVTGTPPAVTLAGLAYDPSTGTVILFGGESRTGVSVATWAYHAKTWTNLSASVGSTPPPVLAPAMVTDTTDNEVVLTGVDVTSTTWVFKGGAWTNVTSLAGAPINLELPVGSDDPAEHGVLVFGGELSNISRTATFVYSGGVWHNLTSTLSMQPPGMYLGAAAYLPSLGGVIAHAGFVFNQTGFDVVTQVTWEFVGGAWRNITDLAGAEPYPFVAFGFAADPNSDAIVLFGGEGVLNPPYSPYTYVLSGPPTVSASASKSTVDAGMSDAFSATVSGGLAPNSVSWDFADGSANVTGTSVSHTYSSSGLFVATVTVTSFVGLTATTTVAVAVDPALAVTANVSASPTAGSAAYFSSSVAGGTGPFTYAWSFGDASASSTSTAPDPSHTYASSGTYTVTLKVTDSAGANVTKTLSVVVGSAPSTSASLTSGTGLGLLIGIIVLVVIVLALAILLMRKPKNPVVMSPAATSPPPPPST